MISANGVQAAERPLHTAAAKPEVLVVQERMIDNLHNCLSSGAEGVRSLECPPTTGRRCRHCRFKNAKRPEGASVLTARSYGAFILVSVQGSAATIITPILQQTIKYNIHTAIAHTTMSFYYGCRYLGVFFSF